MGEEDIKNASNASSSLELKNKLNEFLSKNYIAEAIMNSFSGSSAKKAEGKKTESKIGKLFGKKILSEASYECKEVEYAESTFDSVEPQPYPSSFEGFMLENYEGNGLAKRLNLYMFERDITTAMIYERCFVDRKLISKITSNPDYHPSKITMMALCIGLRLNITESNEFLGLAGYTFSNSSKTDLIIKFMIMEEQYDIDLINEMLYEHNERCIGA